MAALLTLASSLVVGIVIVLVPAQYLSFLVLGFSAVAVLGLRPNWYVLAFWAVTTTGEILTTGITRVEISLGGMSINPFGLLNGLLPLFYVSTYFLRGSRPRWIPMRGLLLSLAAWASLSLVIAGFATQGLRQWITTLNWIAAYLIFVEAGWRKRRSTWVALFAVAVVTTSAIGVVWSGLSGEGIADLSHVQAYGSEVIYRASGFLTQPEGAGESLALFAVVCLAFVVGPVKRKELLVLFALLAAGIWFTHARTATFGLLAGCLLVLWRSHKLNWLSGLLALATSVLLIVTNPRFDWSATLAGNVNPIVYANAFWRIDTWGQLLRPMTLTGYLFGNGIGSAIQELGASPHNEYVVYLHDLGLVGLGFLVMIEMTAFRYGSRMFRQASDDLGRTWGLACAGLVLADAVIKCGDMSASTTAYSYWLTVGMVFLSSKSASSGEVTLSCGENVSVAIAGS